MDYEQKYKEVLERAKSFRDHLLEIKENNYAFEVEYIFPELKESDDERIRKALIKGVLDRKNTSWTLFGGIDIDDILAWLEKQGEHLENYDEAEKEKYDFVSGQFIECRKSFNEFKEDNSYWLEYIGNDTYIGRSDNILNKKFHITPRQLYRLFTQQHCPKENNVNEETNAPTGYGKYVDEQFHSFTIQDAKPGDVLAAEISEYNYPFIAIYKDRGFDFFNSYCFVEMSGTFHEGEIGHSIENIHPATKEQRDLLFKKMKEAGYKWDAEKLELKKIEQEPADNVKTKFHVGDWVVQENVGVYKVIEVCKSCYEVVDNKDEHYSISFDKEYMCHLWTINDAKDGDVLQLGKVTAIFKKFVDNGNCRCYCSVCNDGDFEIPIENGDDNVYGCNNVIPATKKQREILFEKMNEAGYEWDAEKLELRKIEQKLNDEEYKPKFKVGDKLISIKNPHLTYEILDAGIKNEMGNLDYKVEIFEDGRKDNTIKITHYIECKKMDSWGKLIEQKYAEGSEENEVKLNRIVGVLERLNVPNTDILNKDIEWLKSIKDRCSTRFQWKPSNEQMRALQVAKDSNFDLSFSIKNILELLYHDLKALL